MRHDIFNYCCNAATGDIFNNATGDPVTSGCTQNLPYSDSRIKVLRDRVSVTLNNKAMAEAEREKAYKDWKNCKKKLFCNAKPKNDRLDEKEAAQDMARIAYTAAKEELAMAEKANAEAKAEFEKCQAEEKERIKQLPPPVSTDINVASAGTSKSNYLKYGLIGAGVLGMVAIAAYIIKK